MTISYESPRIVVLGSVHELTAQQPFNKIGRGQDQFSSLVDGLVGAQVFLSG